MSYVDRGEFAGSQALSAEGAYEDKTWSIGNGAMISKPSIHAYCLEKLVKDLIPGGKVLDVGCGSGYLTAAFYELVKDSKNLDRTAVVGMEHI